MTGTEGGRAPVSDEDLAKGGYLVFRPGRHNEFHVLHDTETAAIQEASRLSTEQGGRSFVLQVIDMVEAVPGVTRVDGPRRQKSYEEKTA